MLIYIVLNLVNKKIYIGKTERSLALRWKCHRANARFGSPGHFMNAIRKYGEESFVPLKFDTASSSEELCQKEIKYIAEYNTRNPLYGYNMTDGGEGVLGYCPSEETRQKMRLARSRYQLSPETYAKAAASRRGLKHSPEWIAKRIASRIRNGKKISLEGREKMRIAKLGKKMPPRSAEHCANIGKAKMGHTLSPESRAKISVFVKNDPNHKTNSAKGGHTACHVRRGIKKESCIFCYPPAQKENINDVRP